MASNGLKIAVVGGGLAGLAAAMKIAEAGHAVDLFSVVPVKRSHSVCAQGGINGAVNTKGEGDSTWEHFDDTVYGGDFLANQPPAKAMCEMAPAIIYLFDRMGVPFSRTKEGLLDFRRFGGTKHHRTAFAGASTGQQLLYALDEQVRRFEVSGKVRKFEHWEMLSLVLDDHQVCRGLIAMNLQTLELKAFPADAVIIATGGPGLIFGKSTNSMVCTGSAVSAAYQQGAKYANGEFIQVHPTSIPGEDKLRLMSESARGEGGRVWVPRKQGDTRSPSSIPENERMYFLEEKYPAYGNLVPRDIATREIFQVCIEGMGVGATTRCISISRTFRPQPWIENSARYSKFTKCSWATIRVTCRCASFPACIIRWVDCGSTSTNGRTFPDYLRQANATTRFTAQIVSAPTRSSVACTAVSSLLPRQSSTRRT
jgi:succinate dehydrogenase / fumarate reductase flavoprotein subunit